MFSSLELRQYLPPLDELMTKLDEVNAFCQGQIAAMESLSPQDAKIRFIGNLPPPPLILFNLFCFLKWQLSVILFLFSRDPDHLASVWFQQFLGPEGQPERLSVSMYNQHQPRGGAIHQFQKSGTLKKPCLLFHAINYIQHMHVVLKLLFYKYVSDFLPHIIKIIKGCWTFS